MNASVGRRSFIRFNGGGCCVAPPEAMGLIVWNCRELGNLVTEKELSDLTQVKDPSIMFITETCTDEARLKNIKRRLHFDHMFFVPRIHRGGRLVLYWKETMNLKVETSSKNHIDCIIGKGNEGAWRFIGFCSEPNT